MPEYKSILYRASGSHYAGEAGRRNKTEFLSEKQSEQMWENLAGKEESKTVINDLQLSSLFGKLCETFAALPYPSVQDIYYRPLQDPDDIGYRQEIFQDLFDEELYQGIRSCMKEMDHLKEEKKTLDAFYYPNGKYQYFTEVCESYSHLLEKMYRILQERPIRSQGLLAFRTYLGEILASSDYKSFLFGWQELREIFQKLRCNLVIHKNKITIRICKDSGEDSTYVNELREFFAKFDDGNAPEFDLVTHPGILNRIEQRILDRLADMHAEPFEKMAKFYETYEKYVFKKHQQFDYEILFYLSYMDYIDPLRHMGLSFSSPVYSLDGSWTAENAFDLCLAGKLQEKGQIPVTNTISMGADERIIVVTGPNQGGKTTFLRMIGQMYYLAMLGMPVPGSHVTLYPIKGLHTHFERSERELSKEDVLSDELYRIHQIIDGEIEDHMILINEMFSSVAVKDAIELGGQMIEEIAKKKGRCIYVTFLAELASYNDEVVSMVSEVEGEDSRRSFRIIRKPADGKAYAETLAHKYNLTYKDIVRRLDSHED